MIRNKNNLLIQEGLEGIFVLFAFVRQNFKVWEASASRACAGRRPAPPYLDILSDKREKNKYAF